VQAAERAGGPPVQGDPAADAFDDFARRERPALVAFAWTLTGSLATAEEVAQEAIAAAWRSWDQIGGYDKPGAWARRVVANQAATWRRSAGREERALTRLAGRREHDHVVIPDADDELWRAVRALPERQAHAVALFYLEDRSVADIAEILECAESTVKVHLHKGRLSLARTLGLLTEEDAR
jgi:RNA polymerase sigma-70 factor, ECF subfamily